MKTVREYELEMEVTYLKRKVQNLEEIIGVNEKSKRLYEGVINEQQDIITIQNERIEDLENLLEDMVSKVVEIKRLSDLSRQLTVEHDFLLDLMSILEGLK